MVILTQETARICRPDGGREQGPCSFDGHNTGSRGIMQSDSWMGPVAFWESLAWVDGPYWYSDR